MNSLPLPFCVGLLLLCLTMLSASTQAVDPAGEVHTYKEVAGRQLRLWITNPENAKPADHRPAVVFFHGGGWVSGTPTQFDTQRQYLASRGMVAITAEYRLLEKTGKQPPTVCCQDAKSAMRWVRSHAAELGIDPNRIASGGGSAGGHLAAFVGMVPGTDDPADDATISPKSNAMLLFNPVFDNGPQGWGAARVGDRYKEFSPAHNIRPDAPPAIVFLGTQDKLIPVATVESFRDAMKKENVRCEAFFYADQPHGFFNKEPYQTNTLIQADIFLTSLGWLTGPPTLKPLPIPATTPAANAPAE